ncbi:pantetheine-phosphate adenylyltransferase [Candidatus Gottesmanbacteria bacterium]|nr:pantetheine-phosphate adenylyltransferase [Candidatus Gottesmanbacteria bacterium]
MNKKYSLVATGGTFDRFHRGHEALLTKAFEVSNRVIIGITSDEMVKREKRVLKDHVLPYNKRVVDVKKFLKLQGWLGREVIAPLNNVYGPTVLENPVEAIVCTRETRFGATAINRARVEKGLQKADIIESKFIVSQDKRHISSTRIRLGEEDRQGFLFKVAANDKKLPQKLRDSLHFPIGDFYTNLESILSKYSHTTMIISVGDFLYQSMLKAYNKPNLAFIDNKNDHFDYQAKNPAGRVTKNLFTVTKKAIKDYLSNKKNLVIYVNGEEDLTVLPAILLSPLDSLILYGQPAIDSQKSGIVAVVVSEEKKKWASDIYNQFDI